MLQKGKKIGFEKIILWGVVAYVVYMIIKEMSKPKNGSDSVEVSGDVSLETSSDGLPETKRLVSSGAIATASGGGSLNGICTCNNYGVTSKICDSGAMYVPASKGSCADGYSWSAGTTVRTK